jgi:hypothetical protein
MDQDFPQAILMIIKGFSVMATFRIRFQAHETKRVNFFCGLCTRKKVIKFEGMSAEVIENTCRKHVNFLA